MHSHSLSQVRRAVHANQSKSDTCLLRGDSMIGGKISRTNKCFMPPNSCDSLGWWYELVQGETGIYKGDGPNLEKDSLSTKYCTLGLPSETNGQTGKTSVSKIPRKSGTVSSRTTRKRLVSIAGDYGADILSKKAKLETVSGHLEHFERAQSNSVHNDRKRKRVDDNSDEGKLKKKKVKTSQCQSDEDKLDSEVAMYMANNGPPTIRDYRPVSGGYITPRTPSCTGGQENTDYVRSPWLRCIEGCYHKFRSPPIINRAPNSKAIRILDPWPCLYRNTKFGELKKVGTLELEDVSSYWRKI